MFMCMYQRHLHQTCIDVFTLKVRIVYVTEIKVTFLSRGGVCWFQ